MIGGDRNASRPIAPAFHFWPSRGDGPDEPIPLGRYRLDVARVRGVVTQRPANLADRGVQGVVDVQDDIPAPDAFGDLLAEHELPAPLDEEQEHFQRDPFETDAAVRTSGAGSWRDRAQSRQIAEHSRAP